MERGLIINEDPLFPLAGVCASSLQERCRGEGLGGFNCIQGPAVLEKMLASLHNSHLSLSSEVQDGALEVRQKTSLYSILRQRFNTHQLHPRIIAGLCGDASPLAHLPAANAHNQHHLLFSARSGARRTLFDILDMLSGMGPHPMDSSSHLRIFILDWGAFIRKDDIAVYRDSLSIDLVVPPLQLGPPARHPRYDIVNSAGRTAYDIVILYAFDLVWDVRVGRISPDSMYRQSPSHGHPPSELAICMRILKSSPDHIDYPPSNYPANGSLSLDEGGAISSIEIAPLAS